ncbi:hypothetical protein BGZ59_010466 [Podila verticillata]|nr:hypothetical protein BGZ59_010466 [Podila verticillata]KFH64899.1 hypothetical protein MVEG_09627 [Podila verticillata NRRL 6337]
MHNRHNWKEESRLKKQRLKQREKRQKQSQNKRIEHQKLQPEPRESTDINPTQEANSLVEDVGCAQIQIQVQPAKKDTINQHQQAYQPAVPCLSRYGAYIRTIPDIQLLWLWLRVVSFNFMVQEVKTPKAPTVFDLLEHFLSRCACLRLPMLCLNQYHFQGPKIFQLIRKYAVPAAVHLQIIDRKNDMDDEDDSGDSDDSGMWSYSSGDYSVGDDDINQRNLEDRGKAITSRDAHLTASTLVLKHILMNTSRNLKSLHIDMKATWVTKKLELGANQWTGRSDFMSGLEDLWVITVGRQENRDTIACWEWIWKHAVTLKHLDVMDAFPDFVHSLVQGIQVHLNQLQTICLGGEDENKHKHKGHFYDMAIARLLNAGTCFKTIYLGISARVGLRTINTLPRHYPALTEFTMEIGTDDDSFLVDVLTLSPKLRKLVTIRNGEYPLSDCEIFPKLDAKVFADLDPRTKTHRPWACESTLVTLHVKIVNIPAKYDEHGNVLCQLEYVYGRLARLTNLEDLKLQKEVEYQVHGEQFA